jgi:hypothetical protein
VARESIPRFEARVAEWKQRFATLGLESRLIDLPNPNNAWDNTLLVVQRTR